MKRKLIRKINKAFDRRLHVPKKDVELQESKKSVRPLLLKGLARRINKAFDLQLYEPKDVELQELMKSVRALEFDGVAKGKENLRSDFEKFSSDFKKSTIRVQQELRLI